MTRENNQDHPLRGAGEIGKNNWSRFSNKEVDSLLEKGRMAWKWEDRVPVYKRLLQVIQEYVYGMNITSRWGGQTPFSNITLDWTVPEDMKNDPVIVGGKLLGALFAQI
jgi:ABC-type transport system substrate-binding protein